MSDINTLRTGFLDQEWERLVDAFAESDAGDGQPFKQALLAHDDAEALRSLSDADLLFVGYVAWVAINEVATRAANKSREGN